jgi:hypothetical protein
MATNEKQAEKLEAELRGNGLELWVDETEDRSERPDTYFVTFEVTAEEARKLRDLFVQLQG